MIYDQKGHGELEVTDNFLFFKFGSKVDGTGRVFQFVARVLQF